MSVVTEGYPLRVFSFKTSRDVQIEYVRKGNGKNVGMHPDGSLYTDDDVMADAMLNDDRIISRGLVPAKRIDINGWPYITTR